jgi:hypothetical protein
MVAMIETINTPTSAPDTIEKHLRSARGANDESEMKIMRSAHVGNTRTGGVGRLLQVMRKTC